MNNNYDSQSQSLRSAVTTHSEEHGATIVGETVDACSILLLWLDYLQSSVSGGSADEFLDGTQGAIQETAGCLSLGLVRPAIFSIRAEVDLLLAWIYFNDHPVEWAFSKATHENYPLRAEVLKYLRNYNQNFNDRFQLLAKHKTRSTEDPYGLLSVHVHGSTTMAMPATGNLETLVKPEDACKECVQLQAEVSEYLTDVLAAWYADRWADFPPDIMKAIESRLNKKEKKEFFA